MKSTSFLRIAWRVLGLGIALWLPLLAVAQASANLDMALRDLSSEDPTARGEALYDLLALGQWGGQVPRGIANLLRAYPNQAEGIKTALITALEHQSVYFKAARQQNLVGSRTEFDSEVWANLIWAAAYLRDPRALKGLLGAIGTGGLATGGLADLGAVAVDALIERARDPDAAVRNSAIQAIGGFLTRLEAARSSPEAAAKAKGAIRAALDDSASSVRSSAIGALILFREEPEIRARLEAVASGDPEMRWANDGKLHFPVREDAARVLSARESELYYVVRTPESGECRIRKAPDPPIGVALYGPLETADAARHVMCTHLDGASKESSLCWSEYPKNACGQ